MELFGLRKRGDAAEAEGSKSGSSSTLERIRDWMWSKLSLEGSRVSSSGEERYLTRAWVFGSRKREVDQRPEEPHRSGSSLPETSVFKTRAENIVGCHEEVKDKIQKTLKLLTFREQRILIQFWSPLSAGKNKILTTVDQPFGLGMLDEGLCYYRRESERNLFLVDEECKEKDLSPFARVFRQGLPEWTSDITNYFPEDYPQQDCAARWNLHGCLVLPVFDSFTRSCVGVLELITSSEYLDYAYEVQEVHRTLKATNLTSPQAFDHPTSYVNDANRQHELDEIFRILKDLCDTYKLPLAQTWTVSSLSSFVATGRNIESTCSSFNACCIGKVCMSTTALPFYARDLRVWHFREACKERHLQKSQGVVGRALSSHGTCFCGDVTKLGEDEYPLVHNARMSGLTSCFAIYLHSIESNDDYVLEFFLPFDTKEGADLPNVMQNLKLDVKFSSGFELGDILSTEVIGMSKEVSKPSLAMQPDIIHTTSVTAVPKSLSREVVQLDSKDSQIAGENHSHIDCINVSDQCDSNNGYPKNCDNAITNTEEMAGDDVAGKKIDVVTVEKGYNPGEKVSSKQSRKRKKGSLTLEAIQQYFGKPIGEASMRLGVSRSTLKRVCRELKIPSWPLPPRNKTNAHFGISIAVFVLVRVKRWSCSSKRHGFSSRWWICGKHSGFLSKPKLSREAYGSSRIANPSSILPEYEPICGPSFYFSQLLNELEGFTATATQFSESWRLHFGIYEAACLLLGLKRWRKRSSRFRREYLAVCENTGKAEYSKNIVGPYLHPYVVDWKLSDASATLHASPKRSVTNVLDIAPSVTGMVMVKATFRDDMIKFRLPLSSGLVELENQVAQRIKLKSRRLLLKYKDEDDDLILIACDADLHNFLGSSLATSGGNSTIKLIVQVDN